jgi:hypothetical protein
MKHCAQCNKPIAKYANKYCSNQCQSDHIYSKYIEDWRRGTVNGERGINTKNLSGHILRYIKEKYAMKCAICGWDKINKVTGNFALEIDHIDGNPDNNKENNLLLLCTNCHSLTSNYKNLNKGSGRVWRREKYVKIVQTPP